MNFLGFENKLTFLRGLNWIFRLCCVNEKMNGIFSQSGSELPKFYFGKIMVANEVCELFF